MSHSQTPFGYGWRSLRSTKPFQWLVTFLVFKMEAQRQIDQKISIGLAQIWHKSGGRTLSGSSSTGLPGTCVIEGFTNVTHNHSD
jgi:hypothetical protein